MTQQVFASFLNVAPATISGIFNGRTNPTLAIVEAIKKKIPNISTDWIMFGVGDMYVDQATPSPLPETGEAKSSAPASEPMLDFGGGNSAPLSTPSSPSAGSGAPQQPAAPKTIIQYVDKPQRQITEIRIFYDDQTWETFVPKH